MALQLDGGVGNGSFGFNPAAVNATPIIAATPHGAAVLHGYAVTPAPVSHSDGAAATTTVIVDEEKAPLAPAGPDQDPTTSAAATTIIVQDLSAAPDVSAKPSSVCRLSLIALIVAGVVFSGVTAAGQLLVLEGYHPFQVTFVRAIGLTTFTLGHLSYAGEVPVPRDPATGVFRGVGFGILYGILACVDFGAAFIGATWLPLTEVTALWSLNPIFAATVGRIWLGERVSIVHALGVFVFLGGAICAIDPPATFGGASDEPSAGPKHSASTLWIARALLLFAAITSGVRVVVARRFFSCGVVSSFAAPFWMGFIGLLLPGATSCFLEFKHDGTWSQQLVLIATAVGSFVGQSLFGYAIPRESAVVFGVLWNLYAVFSLFWQPVLFGIAPTMYQYISVALVTVGGGVVGAEPQIAAIAYRCLGRAPPSSVVINVTTTTGASTTAVDKKTDDCAPRPPSDDARAALMRHPTPATALSRRPAASTPHDPMGTDRELTSVEV